MARANLRAARANRVFWTDKNIRPENAVMDKSKDSLALLLYKIADCERMVFYPFTIGDPRGRLFVRAKLQLCNNWRRDLGRPVE